MVRKKLLSKRLVPLIRVNSDFALPPDFLRPASLNEKSIMVVLMLLSGGLTGFLYS